MTQYCHSAFIVTVDITVVLVSLETEGLNHIVVVNIQYPV
jgi:hypothetical protein